MNNKQFAQLLRDKSAQLKQARAKDLPRIVGKLATDHYRENFIKGGFVNNGIQRWKPSLRLSSDSPSARDKSPTLLSSRKELYNSVRPGKAPDGVAKIISDKPYSRLHNEGGTVTQNVKAHTRRNWAANLQRKQSKEPPKERINVRAHVRLLRMPKRQFMGRSAELDQIIQRACTLHIRKVLGI